MVIHRRRTALAGQTLLDLLLLLEGLHKRLFQSIGVLRLQGLLHIGGDALLADHLGILVGCGKGKKWLLLLVISSKNCKGFLTLLFPFPNGRKVNLALGTAEGCCHSIGLLVDRQIVDHRFQAKEIDKVRVAGIWNKVHLWRWWLWWGNLFGAVREYIRAKGKNSKRLATHLQQRLFQLLSQCHFSCRLSLSGCLGVLSRRRAIVLSK